jgi:hypothetical protein
MYWNIRSNGSHVALLRNILSEIGLVVCESKSYKPGQWCQRWAPAGRALDLPFIQNFVELKPEIDSQAAKDQQSAYLPDGGGATTSNSIYIFLPKGMKYASTVPIERDEDGIEVYPSWRHQIRSLEEEFRQRELV